MSEPAITNDKPLGDGPSALAIQAVGGTLIGRRHSENQDSYFIDDEGTAFVVADGMGSRAGAKRASQLAVELLAEGARDIARVGGCQEAIMVALQKLFQTVNRRILETGQLEPEFLGLATTAVIAMRCGDELFITGVGDSRAYLIRRRRIQRCTEDQSMAQLLLDAGLMSRAEAETSSLRHVLWQCLGGSGLLDKPLVEVVDLLPGDKVLLATDGLTNVLSEQQLVHELAQLDSVSQGTERLLDAVLARQARDDATCVTLFVDLPESGQ